MSRRPRDQEAFQSLSYRDDLQRFREGEAEHEGDSNNKQGTRNDPHRLIDDIAVNEERESDKESNEHSPKHPLWVEPLPVQTENRRHHDARGNRIEDPP